LLPVCVASPNGLSLVPFAIDLPSGVYCVTLHCERRESISVEEQGRRGRVGVVAKVLLRFNTKMLAYCLMGSHYHFAIIPIS